MRRHLLLLAFALVAQGAFAQAPETPALSGRFEVVDGQRTLTLWGGPEERGFAHGWLLAETIVEDIGKDLDTLLFKAGVPPALYDAFIVKTVVGRFAFTPGEEAELKGILAGIEARLPAERRRIARLDRPIGLDDLKALNTAGDWMALGCSTVALDGSRTADGRPAAVRNFDFPGLRAVLEDQHVLVVAPHGGHRGFVAVSWPGAVGITTGMSEEGLFVSIHDVRIKPAKLDALRPNAPRCCALRRLLTELPAKGAVHAAFEMLRGWPTLYGNNVMVVTPDAGEGGAFAGVVEYDSRQKLDGGATLRLGDGGEEGPAHVLVATNHHRIRGRNGEPCTTQCRRYRDLGAFAKSHDARSVDELFALANQAALPKEGKPQESLKHGTLHQAVALTGKRELWVKLGRPGMNIREVRPRRLEVAEVLAGARPLEAATAGR